MFDWLSTHITGIAESLIASVLFVSVIWFWKPVKKSLATLCHKIKVLWQTDARLTALENDVKALKEASTSKKQSDDELHLANGIKIRVHDGVVERRTAYCPNCNNMLSINPDGFDCQECGWRLFPCEPYATMNIAANAVESNEAKLIAGRIAGKSK